MARRKHKKQKKTQTQPEALAPRLRFHLRCLHLDSEEAYLAWCRTHGYDARLTKTEGMLRRELVESQRRTATAALARSRGARDPASMLARICTREIAIADAPLRLRSACERIETLPDDPGYRGELAALFLMVGRRARFVMESRRFGARSFPYIDALIGLHERRYDWIRPLDTYRPRTHNRNRQFTALAQHLLAEYPVPVFLDAAWFRRDAAAASMRDWYVHLGRGRNLRTADTPVPVTRRIAHHFSLAPENLSVEGALRWAEVRAQGGDEALARAVVETPIGASLEHDAFWRSVVRFFVEQSDLIPQEVGPIVDYIRYMKFEPLEVVLPGGSVEERPPPQPGLCMRYRTLRALRSEVTRWHRRLARSTGDKAPWAPCGIRSYTEESGMRAKGNLQTWRIQELRSRCALVSEAHFLKHCVASYAPGCKRGDYSIWSLSREADGITRRVQTIQVSKYKTITQCRGKHNRMPTDQVRRIVLNWATREGIAPGVVA